MTSLHRLPPQLPSLLRKLRALSAAEKQRILQQAGKEWRKISLSPLVLQSLAGSFSSLIEAGSPGWKALLSSFPALGLKADEAQDCLDVFLDTVSLHGTVVAGEVQPALLALLRESFLDHRENRNAIAEKLGSLLLQAHNGAVAPNSFLQIARDISGAAAASFFAIDSAGPGFCMRGSVPLSIAPGRAYSIAAKDLKAGGPRSFSCDDAAGLLDERWTGRYRKCWSIPVLRSGRLSGLLQLAFPGDAALLPSDISLLQRTAEYLWSSVVSADFLQTIAGR